LQDGVDTIQRLEKSNGTAPFAKALFQFSGETALMPAGFVRGMRPVDGTTRVAQVVGMASSTQTNSSADWPNPLPQVQLEVRQGGARPVAYALDGIDFLIGSVPGCDLRVAAALVEMRHLSNDTHHCPHGRPTALLFTRQELDRQFRRI